MDGGLATPPSSRLLAGETVVRWFCTDVATVRATSRRVQHVALAMYGPGYAGMALAVVLVALVSAPWRVPLAVTFLVAVALVVAGRFWLLGTKGLDPRHAADQVYLTSQRVMLIAGRNTALESIEAIALQDVQDVVFWQTRTMRRAGLTWTYIVPKGVTKLEEGYGLNRGPTSGVLEVQNLSIRDAEQMRGELLQPRWTPGASTVALPAFG